MPGLADHGEKGTRTRTRVHERGILLSYELDGPFDLASFFASQRHDRESEETGSSCARRWEWNEMI